MFTYTKRYRATACCISTIFVVAAGISVLTLHPYALYLAMFVLLIKWIYWLLDDDLDFSANRLASVTYDKSEIMTKYRYSVG